MGNAEVLAFNKKYQPQQEILSAQLQGDLSSLYGLILFLLSHMFSNTVLIPCGDGFCKEPRFLIEGASKIALFPFCVWRRKGEGSSLVITDLFALKMRRLERKLTVKLAACLVIL